MCLFAGGSILPWYLYFSSDEKYSLHTGYLKRLTALIGSTFIVFLDFSFSIGKFHMDIINFSASQANSAKRPLRPCKYLKGEDLLAITFCMPEIQLQSQKMFFSAEYYIEPLNL